MGAPRHQLERPGIEAVVQEVRKAFLTEEQRRVLVFPAHHFVEEPLHGIVGIRIALDPVPDVPESAFAISPADESVGMVGDLLPCRAEFVPITGFVTDSC